MVDREAYDLLFGERKAPDGTQLGKRPGGGRKAADIYARLLAAEPRATAERLRELRIEAARQARQGPLYFDCPLDAGNHAVRGSANRPGPARGWHQSRGARRSAQR